MNNLLTELKIWKINLEFKIQGRIDKNKFLRKIFKKNQKEFFEQVENDVKIFKIVKDLYDEGDLANLNEDPLIRKYLKTRGRYIARYCPYESFMFSNDSNKLKYLQYRIEIDKLLELRREIYPKIALGNGGF